MKFEIQVLSGNRWLPLADLGIREAPERVQRAADLLSTNKGMFPDEESARGVVSEIKQIPILKNKKMRVEKI